MNHSSSFKQARGVLYTEALPINIIGPVLCAITAGGLGFKYVKEAVTWKEEVAPTEKVAPAEAVVVAEE